MIRLLMVLVAIVVILPGATLAQGPGGTVALFADPYGSDCNIWDITPNILNIYVVHIWHPGAIAVQFSAPHPPCFSGAIYLTDIHVMPFTIGNSQTGIIVGYGGCLPAPTHVLTMQYFGLGQTPACCRYPVLPDPTAYSGQIEATDCTYNIVFSTPGRAYINPDASCMCSEPVPVEETSWGQIKALYK